MDFNKDSYKSLVGILERLKEDQSKKDEYVQIMIKFINSLIKVNGDERDYNDTFTCTEIFISRGSSDDFVVSVIPEMKFDNILDRRFLNSYKIDINVNALVSSYSPEDIAVLIVHDILANIVTDETLLRLKKLLVKYYDTNNDTLINTIKVYGPVAWCGIFGNTDKLSEKIKLILDEFGLLERYTMTLNKFKSVTHTTNKDLMDDAILRSDKIYLLQWNKIARRYATDTFLYNDNRYDIYANNIRAATGSDLLYSMIKTRPIHDMVFREKESFTLYNDQKLLYESAEIEDMSYPAMQSKLKSIKEEMINCEDESCQLLQATKLKDMIKEVDAKIESITRDRLQVWYELKDEINKTLQSVIKQEAPSAQIITTATFI